MAKMIKLTNGPCIRSNQIIQIGEPFQDMGIWCYIVAYNSEVHNNIVVYHVVMLNPIIQKEERAIEYIERFVSKINDDL